MSKASGRSSGTSTGGTFRHASFAGTASPRSEVTEGPAIVELDHTTAVVHPGQRIGRDGLGNLVIERSDIAGSEIVGRSERVGVVTAAAGRDARGSCERAD